MENTVKNLLTRMSEKEILDIYNKLNSEGNGFEVGTCGDTLHEACKEEDYTVFHSVGTGDREVLCAISCEGMCVLVADVNGPWGVVYAPEVVIALETLAPGFPEHTEQLAFKMQGLLYEAGYSVKIRSLYHKQDDQYLEGAVNEAWDKALKL